MKLDDLANKYGTDKGSTFGAKHGYTPYYETHLRSLRAKGAIELLEIGVQTGASLLMWREWLPKAHITGIDIEACEAIKDTDIEFHKHDATTFVPVHNYDVIIDDGSHLASDIVKTCVNLWPFLNSGGWWVIEDWATQWEAAYGGHKGGSAATNMAHTFLDEVLGKAQQVSEIHVYREILFIRKA